jgi:hypothetical protein
MVTPDPKADAEHLCAMTNLAARGEPDGTWQVASGPDRADFVFLTRDALSRQYPGVPIEGLPERGGVGLVLAVDDPSSARRALGTSAVVSGDALVVPPAAANHVMLAFVAN